MSPARLVLGSNAGIYALFALGLCAIFSYCGQFSMAQGLFAMVSGFIAASLSVHTALPLLGSAGIGIAAAALVAAFVGLFLFRLRGFYFAIGTLLLSEIGTVLAANEFSRWTGGDFGLPLHHASFGPITLLDLHQRYYVVWGLVVAFAIFFSNLEGTRVVRAARAIKSNERVAQLMGIDALRTKIVMLVLSAVLAGIAGVILIVAIQYIDPGTFDISLSVLIFVGTVIGGRRNFWGAILGGIFLVVLGDLLRGFNEGATLLYGLIYIGVLLVVPNGMIAIPQRLRELLRPRQGPPRTEFGTATAGGDILVARPRVHAGAGDQPCLEVVGLSVRLGSADIVRDVSLSVRPQTILALMGPNGAGKTTVMNAITGFVPASAGSIRLNGKDITNSPIHVRRRLGIARTLQKPFVFGELSTWENIAVGLDFEHPHGVIASGLGLPQSRRAEASAKREAQMFARRVGLGAAVNWPATRLSLGQRRLLEVARAIVGTSTVLLLDEPFAGLAPVMIDHVKEILVRLRADGHAIVLIDHHLEHVESLADEGLFLLDGEIVRQGPISALSEAVATA